jgi:hypothetical protein
MSLDDIELQMRLNLLQSQIMVVILKLGIRKVATEGKHPSKCTKPLAAPQGEPHAPSYASMHRKAILPISRKLRFKAVTHM